MQADRAQHQTALMRWHNSALASRVDLPAALQHVCQPATMLVPWRVSSRSSCTADNLYTHLLMMAVPE